MASVKILDTHKKRQFKIKGKQLPFRIKFISVQVPGYSSTNVAPIGIAVIGFSNYIL